MSQRLKLQMPSPPEDIYSISARDKIFAEASRRWMLQYISYLWQSKDADPFRIGIHTREICREIDTAITAYRAGQSSFIILTVPPRHGKALEINTPIPTPKGFVAIKDLKVDDVVFDNDGLPTRIIAKSEIFDNRELYEIKTTDGFSVIADGEHDWMACIEKPHKARDSRRERIKDDMFKQRTTKYLFERKSKKRAQIKMGAPVLFTKTQLPIEPYILGLWLGDGQSCSGGMTIGPEDQEYLIKKIESFGYPVRKRADKYGYGILGLHTKLGLLGLTNNKHIPKEYLWSSIEDRRTLLQGLMDTDGYVSKDGRAEFCNTRKDLAEGVRHLVVSLGYKASLVVGRSTLYGVDHGERYRVMFYMPDCVTIPRKLARCNTGKQKCHDRAITITKVGTGRTICIQVESESQQYLCGHGFLVTHNSEIVSRMLPTRWLGLFPETEVMVVSYSASLAETFSKDGRKIMRAPEYRNVFPRVSLAHDNAGVQEWGIELEGQPCRGKAQFSGMDGSNTGKGASLIIVDDPLKGRQEADSQLLRDKCWDVFRSDILSRRAPVSIVVITLTRWHQDDIVGRILELMKKDITFPRFKVLSWPASGEKYKWLFPERYGPEYYQAQKSLIGSHAWSALYMCSPVPREGNILRADKVKVLTPEVFDKLTSGMQFARGWDLASGEDRLKEDPDFTSGCRLAKKMVPTAMRGLSMPVFYIADYVRGKWEALARNNMIINTAMGDGEIRVGVEAFGAYKDAYTTVRDILKGIRSVHKSQLPGDKLAKADTVAPAFEAGNVFMRAGPWNEEVLKQFAEFPGGQHDDDVDALCVANDTLQYVTEWS